MSDAPDRAALRARCRRIAGHGPRTAGGLLAAVAAWCEEREIELDSYGRGALIESFERDVAERLGYEAGRFMPSGTMAQAIALRIWAERAGHDHVGMHPTSHLELHEERGLAHLHRLRWTLIGPRDAPLLAEHLAAVPERLAALLVELPIREAGGQLPTWDQLEELRACAADRAMPLHLDGARLWECAAAYDRPLDAITQGFASCYVSFYKGIGALPGSMLLGSRDFIDEAIVWQRRCGGNLHTLTPNVASAAMQLDDRLERMVGYHQRAAAIGAVLAGVGGIGLLPDPPQVNMMHVFLPLSVDDALEARDRVAEAHGLWLFERVRPCAEPNRCRFELTIGDAAMNVSDEDIAAAFTALL